MSHFTCLVVGENPEDQLAPFTENVEPGDEYAVFKDCTQEIEDDYIKRDEKLKAKYPDFDTFAVEYGGYKKENGVYGYWHNPNRKWDWYVLGGRWQGLLKLKPTAKFNGESGQTALFNPSGTFRASAPDLQEGCCDQARICDIDWEGMKNVRPFATFAVLKDGVWYERGSMGWWGVVSNEMKDDEWEDKFAELLASLPEDTLISVYDCHI